MSDEISIDNPDYYNFLRSHPLVKELRGEVFHCTSLENYLLIRDDGWVRPNDGTRQGHYERTDTNLTACEKLDAVSLFDFDQPDDRLYPLLKRLEDVYWYYLEWGKFLWLYHPITVILVFSRRKISTNILGPEECEDAGGKWISNVEVCHRGRIPLSAVKRCYLVRSDQDGESAKQYRSFSGSTLSDDQIDEVQSEWVD